MSDIFQEVDEEIRQENYARLFKRYGVYLIGLAVVLVLGVAGYQAWQAYDLDRRSTLSNSYAAIEAQIAEGEVEAAQAGLAEISDPSDRGYGLLAAFTQARLLAEAGQTAEAVAIWDEIAAKSTDGEIFKSIATLLSVMHQIDDGDPATLKGRLAPLTESGQAFRASALELSALLSIKQGDVEQARSQLEALSQDLFAPAALRERAGQLLNSLTN